jgi:hypothetical protein
MVRRHFFSIQPKKPSYLNTLGGQWIQWHVYTCESCAGLAAAATLVPVVYAQTGLTQPASWIVPAPQPISTDVPEKARRFLLQARETLSSPSASVVMSASAVDAMLKARGYKEGTLYHRIEKAETDRVLTEHMAAWAHDIRLDANDERHADEDATAKNPEDSARCLEFADALADLLFVLPARMRKGRTPPQPPAATPQPAPAQAPQPIRPR